MSPAPLPLSGGFGLSARAFRVLARRARTWPAAIGGVAAVEFALILPVMLTMFLGMSEVTMAVNLDRKLTLLSRSLADLTSRYTSISASQLGDIYTAAGAIMQPYDTSNLKMVITSIGVTKPASSYVGSVDWSCARGTGAIPKPSNVTYTVPSGFQSAGSHYILVEVVLPYSPLFGRTLTGTLNLGDTTPWPIRNSVSVTGPGTCP